MKYKVICSLTILFFLFPFWLNAQNVTDTVKIGGTHQKSNQYYTAPEKIKLDDAQVSVSYQFKHPLSRDKEISFTEDTMVLTVGPRFSIYFDRNDKSRREAFSSYLTHKDSPKVFFLHPLVSLLI